MTKFRVTVSREDTYEIEIDESVWTEEERENFAQVFWPVEELEDVAKDIACRLPVHSPGEFMEGYGVIREFDDLNGDEKWSTKENIEASNSLKVSRDEGEWWVDRIEKIE